MSEEKECCECGSETVAGLLHAKLPATRRRNRAILTWKVWKSFWASARCCGESGVQLKLSPLKVFHSPEAAGEERRSCCLIPRASTLRRADSRSRNFVFAALRPAVHQEQAKPLIFLAGRSESETQRWMSDLARLLHQEPTYAFEAGQFEVTILPSCLSESLGISGVMGRLGVREAGLALRERAGHCKLLGAWGWRQIDHSRCRLAAAAMPEDDGKICAIKTNSLFPGGSSDLPVFCSRGRQLVRCLQNKTASVLATFNPSHSCAPERVRRMSRSEGDLRFVFSNTSGSQQQPQTGSSAGSRPISDPGPGLPHVQSMLASGVMRMGMSLAAPVGRARLSTQDLEDQEEVCSSPEEDEVVFSRLDLPTGNEQRRVSNVSVASGVYETIDDDIEEPVEPQRPTPPPLPPRKYKKLRRGGSGLHAFLRIHKLWRSNSEGHDIGGKVEEQEEEEETIEENTTAIYAELIEPQPLNENLLSDIVGELLMIDSEEDELEDAESLYLPMSSCSGRNRLISESSAGSFVSAPDEDMYVTADRKASLTSDIYALVTGMEPPGTSCP